MKAITRTVVLACVIFGSLTSIGRWSPGTALSALLTASALVLVRDGIRPASRLRSILTVAGLYWGLTYVSNLVEALYFGVIPREDAIRSVLSGFFLAVIVSALLEWLVPRQDTGTEPKTTLAAGMAWRIPLLAFIFFVVYLAAGTAVHRWIAVFYAHLRLPTLQELLVLQLCRGAFDVACVYPSLAQWRRSRARAVWTLAYIFTVLCGWGPLLLPNQFLPGPIRLAHAMEMGASGIVFGAIVGSLLLRPKLPLAALSHNGGRATADGSEHQ